MLSRHAKASCQGCLRTRVFAHFPDHAYNLRFIHFRIPVMLDTVTDDGYTRNTVMRRQP